MHLVIVESPAKAKTINKYLGKDFQVVASFGHVRDLPAKDGSVRPDDDFAMAWQLDGRGAKQMAAITKAVKEADSVYLATDPDREGEAISWHICQVLDEKRALKGKPVQRIVFHEITKAAVQAALKQPRRLDDALVQAYLARRALDYLVGFTLSPVLWRKLPGAKSAGRVQSVALRLICDREAEIEAFTAEEYWSLPGQFTTPKGECFTAMLRVFDGEKLGKMAVTDGATARRMASEAAKARYRLAALEKKQVKRHPYPPFMTSTLQQEAARKLGFSATQTMRTAQQLYESGLITYMRTDGVQLADEAIAATRSVIAATFGDKYVPSSPRVYKSKQKNAQEAHEAIRPTDPALLPDKVRGTLPEEQARLYDLIWKRTLACQMESAVLDRVTYDITSADGRIGFHATGSVVLFAGFLALYKEDLDDDKDDDGGRLPAAKEGDALALEKVTPEQHFTQAPPRYTEASLVKRMEELGIGRPSTYASILQVLKDRDYVRLDKKRFHPEPRGRIVTAFLTAFFGRYVEYDFTATLEEQLDLISSGDAGWKDVLREFWNGFSAAVQEASPLTISEVIDRLNETLEALLFPKREDGKDARACPACSDGRLSLKLGKFGAFVGCSNYPTCNYTRQLSTADLPVATDDDGGEAPTAAGVLGEHPTLGGVVQVKKGPYGMYIEHQAPGEAKPKRAPIPKSVNPATLKLAQAVQLLSLPREIGIYPETGQMIAAGIGAYGAYLKHGTQFFSLGKNEDVLSIGLNRAIVLVGEGLEKLRKRQTILGQHPEAGGDIILQRGSPRFGHTVMHGSKKVKLSGATNLDAFTLQDALALLAPKKKASAKKTAKKKK